MRRFALAVLLAAVLTACGESARQLLETAQLEETQNAPDRARALYERIVREHAGTPEAREAAARLEKLGPGTAP